MYTRIMIFIITILLLAADFYYIKNIAGRRLVGLRWWNEVDPQTGDSQWVFESSEPGTKVINATDSRFFWLALYLQPMLWVIMFILALVSLSFMWLPLVSTSTPTEAPDSFFTLSKNNPANSPSSHRSCPYHHEHPCLLPLRQVQQRLQPRRQRLWHQQPGRQHREQHGQQLVLAQLIKCQQNAIPLEATFFPFLAFRGSCSKEDGRRVSLSRRRVIGAIQFVE